MSSRRSESTRCSLRIGFTLYQSLRESDWQIRPALASWRFSRASCFNRTWLSTIVIVLVVVSIAFNAGVVAQSASSPVVPEPVPGVDRTYNNTFRILASEDADPFYNTTTIQVPEYQPDGSVTIVNETVGTYPFKLDARNLRPTETLQTAYGTDVYFTSLQDQAGTIPYQDTWEPLDSYVSSGMYLKTRIYPLQNVSYGTATSTDGNFRVEVLNTNGYWNPVYNAEVLPDSSTDGYYVANPSTALVHVPAGEWIITRKVEALRSLLQYSELASSETVARGTAVVPMEEGSELYPSHDGASVGLYWRSGSFDLVRDAYIGVSDMPPGVWYEGQYVTQSHQTSAYVPWDYRVQSPSDHTESGSCTIGNNTYSLTRWANYRILDSNTTVDVSIENGSSTQQMYPLGGPGGVWSTYDDINATIHELAPGNYTLSAELTVEIELEREYGVSSARCSEWDQQTTLTRSTTVDHSVPVHVIEADSPDLEIEATLYDRPGDDVLAIEWSGDQAITEMPWQDITVTIGNKTARIASPWHFYSVSQNDAVEERTDSGTSTVAAGHSFDDQYPRLLRNRVAVANVTVRLDERATAPSWWREDLEIVDETIPGTSLPPTILAPDNAGTTSLYQEYAGVILSNDGAMGESVSIEARTPFDMPVDQTTIEVIPYEESKLELWVEGTNGTSTLVLRLTDPDTGLPLSGRTISLRGAATDTVTTNSSGMATATPTGTNIMATFEGDDWKSPRSTYYLGDTEGVVTGFGVIGGVTDLFGYIDMGISNTVLIIEWITLGAFALWWVRFREQTRRRS